MREPRQKLGDIARPYFDAAARGELVIPQCNSCRRHFFYATVLCQHCHSGDWEWVRSDGAGAIYSHTAVHRPLGSSLPAPYIVVVVELDEGIRMMGNLLDCADDVVKIGQRVSVDFAPSWQGDAVPMFRLAGDRPAA